MEIHTCGSVICNSFRRLSMSVVRCPSGWAPDAPFAQLNSARRLERAPVLRQRVVGVEFLEDKAASAVAAGVLCGREGQRAARLPESRREILDRLECRVERRLSGAARLLDRLTDEHQ